MMEEIMFFEKDFYDLADYSNEEDLIFLRDKFLDFRKLSGLILLKILGFPILDPIIISKYNKRAFSQMTELYHDQSFIVRTDRINETIKLPSGYKIKADELSALAKIIKDGRIVFLLRMPLSRYDHLYSMNLLFDYNYLTMEIIGKGFDVSDLNRGDISPHEIFELPLNYTFRSSSWDIYDFTFQDIRWCRKYLINTSDYKKSVLLRLTKIGAGLTEGGFVKGLSVNLVNKAEEFLKSKNKTLILKNNSCYVPIPFELLRKILKSVYHLPMELLRFNVPLEAFSLGCGVYYTGQIVFWDIVWPSLKFSVK